MIIPIAIEPIPDVEPADLKFLACPEASDSDYLVTGDQKLLDLKTHKRSRIVSSRAFLAVLRER